MQSPPQTNEVRRAGILLPGFLTIASQIKYPLVLSEIGASAGLNMCRDQYSYKLGANAWGNSTSYVHIQPDWSGSAVPSADISVRARGGCDLFPLDPLNEGDRLRLLSYVWADQTERIERCRGALEIAAGEQMRVEKADALDWLETRLSSVHERATHVVYHTVMWQYLSELQRDRGEVMIRAAGARASDKAPLAWLRFETDGEEPGGALTLTLWPGGEERCLARADFHGRWINWFG